MTHRLALSLGKLGRALPLLFSLLVLSPAPLLAQAIDVDVGAGQDVNVPVPPGLDSRTPIDRPIAPEEVPLYIPHEDQLIGRISIPDEKLATLVQPEGRTWRAFRIQGLYWIAAAVILVTLLGLTAFYLYRGRIKLESGWSGRWVPRFGAIDRFAHWTTALSFITLALSGLVVTFGRYHLIPVMGHDAFTALADASKYLHNWSSVPFVIGLVLMLVLWIKDNIPNKADLLWLRHGGGMFKRNSSFHPESERFNAGQKIIFWSVILFGFALAISGYFLMAPFTFTGVSGMQIGHVIHALLAVLLIAVILGHIYIGTLGMEGAFDAMGRGEVDENWAIEHHRGWYEAQIRGSRTAPPAQAPAAPAE
jgi:formate dehydrogenase subunit gamma